MLAARKGAAAGIDISQNDKDADRLSGKNPFGSSLPFNLLL
jgi:hypothetical protein